MPAAGGYELRVDIHEALQPPPDNQEILKSSRLFRETQGADYVAKAAAIVKTAFEVADQAGDPVHGIYSSLCLNPSATPGHLKLASVAYACLGRVLRRQKELYKQAAGGGGAAVAGFFRNLVPAAGTTLPEIIKGMMLYGGAMGAPIGAGAWALNRGLTSENQKLRELEIQRDTYGQLAAEVRAELRRRKLAPTPENQAAAVDYLT